MAGSSNNSSMDTALRLLDELHRNAKTQLEQLIKQEQEKTEGVQTLVEAEKSRAERFLKLYEQERANTKLLQSRLAEIQRLQKSSKKQDNVYRSSNSATGENSESDVTRDQALQFSSLYDIWWPDAYKAVIARGKKDEKAAVTYLLDLIKSSFQFCSEVSQHQQSTLLITLSSPAELLATNSKTPRPVGFPAGKSSAIEDIRMMCTEEAVRNLTEAYSRKNPDYFKDSALKLLAENCLEIFWQLMLHYPRVTMDTETKRGDRLDPVKYRAYKEPGSKVDYIVVPAMYECRGGELLAQGVAHGISS